MKNKKIILIKIGGSVITYKSSSRPKANNKNIKNIARELHFIYKKFPNIQLILIHGAGSFGHPIVKRTKIHQGIKNHQQLLAMAETQRLQNDLNSIFTKELIEQGLPVFHIQASASTIMHQGKLKHMDTRVVRELLKIDLIPILNGVPAIDTAQGCSILSGDASGTYLAKKFKINKIVSVTSVDGVYDQDPQHSGNAKLIPKINEINLNKIILQIKKQKAPATQCKTVDVTGQILNKILELKKISKALPRHNLTCHIVNGNIYGNIIKAVQNKPVGTIIKL